MTGGVKPQAIRLAREGDLWGGTPLSESQGGCKHGGTFCSNALLQWGAGSGRAQEVGAGFGEEAEEVERSSRLRGIKRWANGSGRGRGRGQGVRGRVGRGQGVGRGKGTHRGRTGQRVSLRAQRAHRIKAGLRRAHRRSEAVSGGLRPVSEGYRGTGGAGGSWCAG